MTNTKHTPTKSEILSIIEAYEGLIVQDFSNVNFRNERTKWVCELLKLEGAR